MNKKSIEQAYADWYRQEQLNRAGCGGPVLIACAIAFVLIIML